MWNTARRAMQHATFHHVGLVVEAIEPAILMWNELGYHATVTVSDPIQKANIVLMARDGQPMIELVNPHGPEAPSFSWIKRIKAGPYHTCFEVPALGDSRRELERRGFMVVMEPVPAVAFGGRHVCFLWSKDTGLFELLQRLS